MAAPPEIPVKAPAHSPPAHPARLILILSLTPTVGLGIGRFAYSLVLPDMRDSLGWSYSSAGFMNTINAAGYLAGALIYNQCQSCHTLDGSKLIGPSFVETSQMYKEGKSRQLKDGRSVKVDDAYLEHSIMDPLAQIAVDQAGTPYPPSMPAGIGQLLGERRVKAMIEFIKHLDQVAPGGRLQPVTREEIVQCLFVPSACPLEKVDGEVNRVRVVAGVVRAHPGHILEPFSLSCSDRVAVACSVRSPRETTTRRSEASTTSPSSSAAALLLTTSAASAPVAARSRASTRRLRSPRRPVTRSSSRSQ